MILIEYRYDIKVM
jgi:membrane protease YdiL (CAAX protease family)